MSSFIGIKFWQHPGLADSIQLISQQRKRQRCQRLPTEIRATLSKWRQGLVFQTPICRGMDPRRSGRHFTGIHSTLPSWRFLAIASASYRLYNKHFSRI